MLFQNESSALILFQIKTRAHFVEPLHKAIESKNREAIESLNSEEMYEVKYQLKAESLATLRTAIRKEKKDRREGWQSWAAFTIGLTGALMGLL